MSTKNGADEKSTPLLLSLYYASAHCKTKRIKQAVILESLTFQGLWESVPVCLVLF
jgi:hypothetical protein